MLAMKPPMGWNSWNTFGRNISEDLIIETCDAMVESGLRDAGYEYIVIDDCWSKLERNPVTHEMEADPEKFPHGMKYLADYIHSKGMKFGMYSCAGTKTCAYYPGSFDHEFLDAKTFASFDIDYLKYDFCYKPRLANGPMLYNRMSMALKASGREILFSACNWGSDEVEKWIRSTGAHIYRSTGDIHDSYDSFKDIAMSQLNLLGYSGPGCYNDIDMLICGMYGKGNVGRSTGCTDDEYRMHFALWCMFGSPLMIGCDVRNMNEATKKLLLDKELIAINQDEEARPPMAVTGGVNTANPNPNTLCLFKYLANNEYCFGVFNFGDRERTIVASLYDMGLPVTSGYGFELVDIETGETLPQIYNENLAVKLATHTCKVYKAKLVPTK